MLTWLIKYTLNNHNKGSLYIHRLSSILATVDTPEVHIHWVSMWDYFCFRQHSLWTKSTEDAEQKVSYLMDTVPLWNILRNQDHTAENKKTGYLGMKWRQRCWKSKSYCFWYILISVNFEYLNFNIFQSWRLCYLTETVEKHLPSLINTRWPSLFKENKKSLHIWNYIINICDRHALV
jgi:hypothetical protein